MEYTLVVRALRTLTGFMPADLGKREPGRGL
jgi:hypothetical protein